MVEFVCVREVGRLGGGEVTWWGGGVVVVVRGNVDMHMFDKNVRPVQNDKCAQL